MRNIAAADLPRQIGQFGLLRNNGTRHGEASGKRAVVNARLIKKCVEHLGESGEQTAFIALRKSRPDLSTIDFSKLQQGFGSAYIAIKK